MIFVLSKWSTETRFCERKKSNNIKTCTLYEKKFILRRKEEFMNFWIKKKLVGYFL